MNANANAPLRACAGTIDTPPNALLIATHNAGKLAELRSLLGAVPYALVSLADVGIQVDVEETGATLEENAALKATAYAGLAGIAYACGRFRP